jgi:CheY-like chemotaxis protein
MVEFLADLLGHEVEAAADGEAGLARARAWGPEVVLCDVGLPRLDGYGFARQARQSPALRGTILIALTGYGSDADRERTRQAGFDHHLTKPLDIGAMERLLAEIAAEGRAAPSLGAGQAAAPE